MLPSSAPCGRSAGLVEPRARPMLRYDAMESRYDAEAAARWSGSSRRARPSSLALRTYTARLVGARPVARPARRRQHVGEGDGDDPPRRGHRRPPRQGIGLGPRDHRARGPPGRAPRAAPQAPRARRDDRRGDGQRAAHEPARRVRARHPASRRCCTRSFPRASSITRTPTPSSRSPISRDGERICRGDLRRGARLGPVRDAGLRARQALRASVSSASPRTSEPTVMVLEKHGLFTWGATAKESYERTIDAVSRAELLRRASAAATVSRPARGARAGASARRAVLPRLRGALAKLAGDASGARPDRAHARSTPAILRVPRAARRRRRSSRRAARRPITCFARSRRRCSCREPPVRRRRDARGAARGRDRRSTRARYDAYFDAMCRAKGVTEDEARSRGRASSSCPASASCAIGATRARGGRRARRLRAHDRRHDDAPPTVGALRAVLARAISSTWSTGASSRPSSRRRRPRRSPGASRS